MKSDNRVDSISIDSNSSIVTALKQMDNLYKKMLLVFDGSRFIGVLSIGDIQRGILKNVSLDEKITTIMRSNISFVYESESLAKIKEFMLANRVEAMPVLDSEKNLVKVYFWEDLFDTKTDIVQEELKLPVVIMAGGKGTRLKPLTNVIPKPLIPIGDKTIVEEIMDKFVKVGSSDFYLSVNYKSETIKHYFETLNNDNYKIKYFQEDKPLGTAGSMYLIKDQIKSTFFVSNCDILIDQDLVEIYKYHRENNNSITVVSALKHYSIPYGTISTGDNGVLVQLNEKPVLNYQINTGVYILEPEMLELIPEDVFFHITDLIEKVKNMEGKKVGVFPISEGSWQDIGEWPEYMKFIKI